ncbi:protein O-mannosyl-transferase Tmtc3 [Trichonephila clavata]|uniref:Protein O-mannosyl-transferase Tmtc3 n=1 Tax=Trichonephila clavata TaxID=2740835 RepID=A0A8X6JLA7_TRICU|nr:protein O-mannosyl-transferase Tmtc3 [Trichonephila clavata]
MLLTYPRRSWKIRLPYILKSWKGHFREAGRRIGILLSWTMILLAVRLKVMSVQLPVFTKFDNPAAAAETPTRQLTFNFLIALNSWLLLCPADLCCDWTMGSVPLILSWNDPRNLGTLTVYVILCAILWNIFWVDDTRSRILLMVSRLC